MEKNVIKTYVPIVTSIAATMVTILGFIVHGKWDAEGERYINELALLVFQIFPIMYYYDVNGRTKGRLSVFGGIVFHLTFGISFFLMSFRMELESTHFVITAMACILFFLGIVRDKIKFY